jgi:transposase
VDIMHRRCAGLDVHQAQVTACIRISLPDRAPTAFTREFPTTDEGLGTLRDWLAQHAVTHVAMEGTGVYWQPVYRKLETWRGADGVSFDLTLCNAHHARNVPGRKTDRSDAAWLAELMAAGLLKKSFVPTEAIRTIRELTRERVHRVEDRAREANALHRLLERSGIKLASVVSDLQGDTARAILRDLAKGERDASKLAEHARGKLRSKKAQLTQVLSMPLGDAPRMLIGQTLERLDLHDAQIAAIDRTIREHLEPYTEQLALLESVPGICAVSAAAIFAEIGPDMGVFASAEKIVAWAGLVPGQNESAGKRKRAGLRHGSPYLRRILVQIAIVLSRTKKPNDLTDFFNRKRGVLGYKKTAVAVAHKILRRIWHLLRQGELYTSQPPTPLSDAQRARQQKRLVARLEALGCKVTLEATAA